MNNETLFKRIAAISAIISAPLAVAGLVIVSLAVDLNFELMSDQAGLIALGVTIVLARDLQPGQPTAAPA